LNLIEIELKRGLVTVCEDFILLQYSKHLELWKLGSTEGTNDVNIGDLKNGHTLPIMTKPKKYIHLNSKNDLHIVCASIGADPANNNNDDKKVFWLAYSDLNVVHIYKLDITNSAHVQIDKIKSLPLACANRPATILNFVQSYDELNRKKILKVCYLTNKSFIQCLTLMDDLESGFVLESTIRCIQEGKTN
jgi:hypothetical protein